MRKTYEPVPQAAYRKAGQLRADDLAVFAQQLLDVPDEVALAWYSHEGGAARPGIWIARQACRVKVASFVDPTDLSCYGGQYFEPAPGGRFMCLRLDRSARPAPASAQHLRTAGQLKSVVANLVARQEQAVQEAAAAGAPAPMFPRLIEPHEAFEWHGRLARGWHAQRWRLEEDGASGGTVGEFPADACAGAPPAEVLVFG